MRYSCCLFQTDRRPRQPLPELDQHEAAGAGHSAVDGEARDAARAGIFSLAVCFLPRQGTTLSLFYVPSEGVLNYAFLPAQDGNPLTPRGENGKPNLNEELQTRQWSERVIRREYREWKIRGGTISKPVQVVVTPRVREEVSPRTHEGASIHYNIHIRMCTVVKSKSQKIRV